MRVLVFLICFVTMSSVAAQIYIPKFDLQGHRGARGLRPENTIPAFLIALDSGVTTIEMDVVITKDKKIVVSHEPWMDADICLKPDSTPIKKADATKLNIYKMTYDEVKQYDCGSKINKRFPEQLKIKTSKPLLEDVIVAVETHIKSFSQYEVDYNIEIKSAKAGDNVFHPTPEEFSDLVYNLIDQYLPLDRVVIQSFDFRVLKYWHEKYPTVRLAALVENKKSVYRNLSELGFNPSIYSPVFSLLDKEDVVYLQKEKIRVIPWTVNEIEDMKKVRQLGVDGFITDYPDRAASLGLGIKRPRP
jgi:glycerophosphoryl diester phosphodiesterase